MKKVAENPLKNRAVTNEKSLPMLVVIVGLLITCYLTANVMAVKLIKVCGVTLFDAGTIVFPFAYMLGDVLTEIWGFKTARKVIWLTFFCEIVFTLFAWIGIFLPYPAETAANAEAYGKVFGFVPRVTIASLAAFLLGGMANAWTMAKIKEKTGEKLLWLRTIGSSIFGYAVDTSLFVCLAFLGSVPMRDILSMIWIQIIVKLLIEILGGTPLAYSAIAMIKRKL